jgi:hypothetical protein
VPVSLLGLFCICERTSHCTQNARWSLSLFLLCAATAVPATTPHGSAKMFLDCNTAPACTVAGIVVFGKTRRTLPAPTQLRHQSGQLCPPRMMPRAPQDGREVRRCYSSLASLLSAVRTRIERPIPSTSPHTSFPICGMSYAPHRCSCRLFKPDEYGRIRRKHG